MEEGAFVKVLNKGTAEYNSRKIDPLIDELDAFGAATKHLTKEDLGRIDKNRTNIQVNYGKSGGENITRSVSNLENDFGASMPKTNKGTHQEVGRLEALSKIAKIFNIVYADDSFIDSNPILKQRFDRFARSYGPQVCFEAFTIAFLPIDAKYKVKDHVDYMNDYNLTEVLVVNEIVHIHGIYVRVSFIAYLRNSCHLAIHRRIACREAAMNVQRFIDHAEPHQLPPFDVVNHWKNAGSEGAVFLIDKKRCSPVLASLMCKPTMDKQISYLGPIASDIRQLVKARSLPIESVLEIAIVTVFLNNFILYSCVLKYLCADPTVTPNKDLGYFGLIFYLMTELGGGNPTNGLRPRSMNRCTRDIPFSKVDESLCFLLQLCKESQQKHSGANEFRIKEKTAREIFQDYTSRVEKRVYGAGDFSSQHLVHLLVQMGLLYPARLLRCAKYALSASTNARRKQSTTRKSKKNQSLIQYLSSGQTKDDTKRAAAVMRGVTAHMRHRQALGKTKVNENHTEGGGCESNRKTEPFDNFNPNDHFILEVAGLLQSLGLTADPEEAKERVTKEALPPLLQADLSPYVGPFYSRTLSRKRTRTGRRGFPITTKSHLDGVFPIVKKQDLDYASDYSFVFLSQEELGREDLNWMRRLFCHSLQYPDVMQKLESNHSLMSKLFPEHQSADLVSSPQEETVMAKAIRLLRESRGIQVSGDIASVDQTRRPRIVLKNLGQILKTVTIDPIHDEEASLLRGFHDVDEISLASIEATSSSISVHQAERECPQTNLLELEKRCRRCKDISEMNRFLSDSVGGISSSSKLLLARSSKTSHRYVSNGSLHSVVTGAINCGYPQHQHIRDMQTADLIAVPLLSTKDCSHYVSSFSMVSSNFFQPGKCLVSDHIAKVLGGSKVVDPISNTHKWGFHCPQIARRHVLLSLYVTAGTKSYFARLYKRCLGQHGIKLHDPDHLASTKPVLTIHHSLFDDLDVYFLCVCLRGSLYIAICDQRFHDNRLREKLSQDESGNSRLVSKKKVYKRQLYDTSQCSTKDINAVHFFRVHEQQERNI